VLVGGLAAGRDIRASYAGHRFGRSDDRVRHTSRIAPGLAEAQPAGGRGSCCERRATFYSA
jgi:hypothetical protein